MKLLWPHWPALRARWRRAPRRFVILDYDGTLAPIVNKPRDARMDASARNALLRLNADPRGHVAILSGRTLRDVRRRVGVRGLFYGGNHGLELAGPGFTFLHPGATLLAPRIRAVARQARRAFRGIPGVRVEDKGLSLTIHHREVPAAHASSIKDAYRSFRSSPLARKFCWRAGDRVWEALPRGAWDKGRAASLLLKHLGNPFPIAVGDDRTDEDMFRAVSRRGITVAVGHRSSSRARYFIQRQGDVQRLLGSLVGDVERRGP